MGRIAWKAKKDMKRCVVASWGHGRIVCGKIKAYTVRFGKWLLLGGGGGEGATKEIGGNWKRIGFTAECNVQRQHDSDEDDWIKYSYDGGQF